MNGNPIYKLENFEEIIPSERQSQNPLVQSWGQGTGGIQEIHNGTCQFNMKNIQYYEEPLDYLAIKYHYNNIKTTWSINECDSPCNESVVGAFVTPTPTPTPSITPTMTPTITPTPTPSPSI